jgi:UDP-xylose/UDP-N-acetylglucosamine transporter B4
MLGLPFFLLFKDDLVRQFTAVSGSTSISLRELLEAYANLSAADLLIPDWIFEMKFPVIWFAIIGNALTQLLCIGGVHKLSATTSSLTVNLALMLRRLISLLLSVYLFHLKFERGHVAGALMVFGGTILYCTVS